MSCPPLSRAKNFSLSPPFHHRRSEIVGIGAAFGLAGKPFAFKYPDMDGVFPNPTADSITEIAAGPQCAFSAPPMRHFSAEFRFSQMRPVPVTLRSTCPMGSAFDGWSSTVAAMMQDDARGWTSRSPALHPARAS